ncbi:RNA polymerase sigma-70 factor, ECF subfamily [Fodinibius roseus]|uniref:RNA polymerase sigma-70 factor, ECF subfamily n=1 Tax=Fodinibius roseus TaxID=1194090 RepID=A0A1M5K963_9BACT|nr:RNA polymerase sigma factor [Fodinibius roseus]SHG49029.1 RNA polymerase sigma-70 factor, ECF subfamily [Fodinibius roseus]
MLRSVDKTSKIKKYNFVSVEKYSGVSDSEIIHKILKGSTQLFEVLMRRYNQRLFRIQRSYISDEEAVKDTLQITYMKAFENLCSFRGDAKFSTWITRIAINEALKYLNGKKRNAELQLVEGDTPMNEHTINRNNTPEDKTIQHDFRQLLEQVVATLPPKYRSVYLMREVEHMDTKETADCLDLTESNVKVRLHRAKKMLQEEIERTVTDTEIFNFLGTECDRLVFNIMRKINQ